LNGLSSLLTSGTPVEQEQALQAYQQSASLYQEVGEQIGAAVISSNMAAIYIQKKQYDLALKNAQQSLAIYHQFEMPNREAWTTLLIGEISMRLGDTEKGLQLARQSLQSFREIGILPAQASALNFIAGVEEDNNQQEDAVRDRE
jgi:tetratricopeptide (TPR) repeat protein